MSGRRGGEIDARRVARYPAFALMQPYGQTLLASIRCPRSPFRPAFRRTCLGRTEPREAQRGCEEGREPQARYELPLPGLQEPVEGPALQIPLRGAPEAAEEEAG